VVCHRSQEQRTLADGVSYQDNGTMSAPDGFHDDVVIAHAIAVYLASQPDTILNTLQLFADLEELSHSSNNINRPGTAG
jgi:hypothetical protein